MAKNRFSKKAFDEMMLRILNDIDYTSEIVKVRHGEIYHDDVKVTKKFRKFCRKLLEQVGMDKSESSIVESEGFKFESVDGLYEFFCEALYQYMLEDNIFGLPAKEDFKGSLYLVDVPETEKEFDAIDPRTKKPLGTYKRKNKKHKKLKAQSTTPDWLTEKTKKN